MNGTYAGTTTVEEQRVRGVGGMGGGPPRSLPLRSQGVGGIGSVRDGNGGREEAGVLMGDLHPHLPPHHDREDGGGTPSTEDGREAPDAAEAEVQMDRMRAIAIATAVTHVLGTAPVSTLYQKATLASLSSAMVRSLRLPLAGLHSSCVIAHSSSSEPSSTQLTWQPRLLMDRFQRHVDEFKQFHRQESLGHVLGSGLLDLLDGATSGALLGALSELTKFGWFIMTLDEEMNPVRQEDEKKKEGTSLAQQLKYGLYFCASNAVCFGATAAICLPLHIANFQVRHHIWRGWRGGVFPLRRNGFWKALPTLSLEYQFMQILNRQVRRYVYDMLGRPFSVPITVIRARERKEKAERRRIKGKEKVIEDEDDDEVENGAKPNEDAEEETEESLRDVGEELLRKAKFHLLTRGIAIGVTLLMGTVHMPLSTVTNSILAAPHAYSGPIDCAQHILATEGWQGFYKGLFWYVLYTSDVLFLHDVWTGAEHSLAS